MVPKIRVPAAKDVGDIEAKARDRHESPGSRRTFALTSVVTLVLLIAGALVSLSPTSSGFITPAAAVVVSTQPAPCSVSSSSTIPAPSSAQTLGHQLSAPANQTVTACPYTPTGGVTSAHSGWLDLGSGKGTTSSYLFGQGGLASLHHSSKSTNGSTKNESSRVHTVFAQASMERWDARSILLRVVQFSLGDQILSDAVTENANGFVPSIVCKIQINSSNICALRAHQFASSL